jgi:hypothetical protein
VERVSQYFQVGQKVLWNPSNGVGLLYVRYAEALEPVAGLPSGIEAANADEWEIRLPVFERFVETLVDRHQRSTHLILRSLMEGFIATSLVLVERGGGSVPGLGAEPGPDVRDIQVSTSGMGARPRPGVLEDLRTAHSKAMPD